MSNYLQKALFIINNLLIILLAYVLIQLVWTVMVPLSANVVQTYRTVAQQVQNLPSAKEIFGKIIEEQAPANKPLLKTTLNLILQGIWLDQEDERNSHVIVTAGNEDEIYYIGDDIASLATVVSIHKDHIVLKRNDQLETLNLRPKTEQAIIQPLNQEPQEIVPKLDKLQKNKLEDIRAGLKDNPLKLSEIMSIKPYYVNKELKGFRIKPGKERELFYQLKLKPNDLVYQINHLSLTTFTDLQIVRDLVVGSDNIHVFFYRDKEPYALVLNL